MKIKTVCYGRSIEFSRNRKTWFSWTAEVEADEDHEVVLDNLRQLADTTERHERSVYGDNPLPISGPGRR